MKCGPLNWPITEHVLTERNNNVYNGFLAKIFLSLNLSLSCAFFPQDNAELFAMMEKTRMYIFRNLDPEVHIYGEKNIFFILVVLKSNNALLVEIKRFRIERTAFVNER